MVLGKIDELGKVGWITVVVLGFWLAWPVGLMLIAFLAGSGRLAMLRGREWRGENRMRGAWSNLAQDGKRPRDGLWGRGQPSSSGNKAFDDYRSETLRRLEEEEREFQAFLERLRQARDKSEFDSFMADRRNRPTDVQEASPAGA